MTTDWYEIYPLAAGYLVVTRDRSLSVNLQRDSRAFPTLTGAMEYIRRADEGSADSEMVA